MARKGKAGGAVEFDAALAHEIAERLAKCELLQDICADERMPQVRIVWKWRRENPEFKKEFDAAKRKIREESYKHTEQFIESREVVVGRPTLYEPEIVARLLDLVEDGMLISRVCRLPGMPRLRTVYDWEEIYPEFSQALARAKQIGREVIADDTFEIADDGTNDYVEKQAMNGAPYMAFDNEHVQRSRLRIDTRQWHLGCHDPRYRANQKIEVALPSRAGESAAPKAVDDVTAAEGYEAFQKMLKGE